MPKGAKPGERRGGRAPGTKNKVTIEREILEQQLKARADARVGGRKLAKEVIEENMHFAAAFAEQFKPIEGNEKANEDKYLAWARLAVTWATDLAPYQSPKFRSIEIAPVKDEDDEDDMVVIHTVDEMRIELLRQGVPPDELGRALLGPAIEHEPVGKGKGNDQDAG
jgi:hypothetical protein